MPFDTYPDLKTEVLAWLERSSDTTAQSLVAGWVSLAESELRQKMRFLRVGKGQTVEQAFVLAAEYVDLPSDCIGVGALRLNSGVKNSLLFLGADSMDARTDLTNKTGSPLYFGLQGGRLRILPSPDTDYESTLTYFSLPSLSDAAPTNWLLTNYPKVYLKAVLAEAHEYYFDTNRSNACLADVDRMLNDIKSSDASFAGNMTMRMRGSAA